MRKYIILGKVSESAFNKVKSIHYAMQRNKYRPAAYLTSAGPPVHTEKNTDWDKTIHK